MTTKGWDLHRDSNYCVINIEPPLQGGISRGTGLRRKIDERLGLAGNTIIVELTTVCSTIGFSPACEYSKACIAGLAEYPS